MMKAALHTASAGRPGAGERPRTTGAGLRFDRLGDNAVPRREQVEDVFKFFLDGSPRVALHRGHQTVSVF